MISRRSFCNCLALGGIAAASSTPAFANMPVEACKPYDGNMQKATTPELAVAMLKAGNDRFIAGKSENCDLIAHIAATKAKQSPFACVLSCVDSRVAPELVFDQQLGDLLVARVAGNVATTDVIGSFEYATKMAGAKAIIVLGHSDCDAIKSAIDEVKLGKNLTALLDKITPAIDITPREGKRSSENHDYVQNVAETNVMLAVRAMTERSAVLGELVQAGQLRIVGAMQDLQTGRVVFLSSL
jgi:carbonic anhydrase